MRRKLTALAAMTLAAALAVPAASADERTTALGKRGGHHGWGWGHHHGRASHGHFYRHRFFYGPFGYGFYGYPFGYGGYRYPFSYGGSPRWQGGVEGCRWYGGAQGGYGCAYPYPDFRHGLSGPTPGAAV